MNQPALFRRAAAAVCLALAGLLTGAFMLLAAAPGWGSDNAERLEAVVSAGSVATASFVVFTVSQLPMVVGLLGVAHLMRGRAPLLSSIGATAAAVSGFAYAVYGGSQLLIPAMAADPDNLQLYAQLRADSEPLTVPFAALGLLTFVIAFLVLSIALWRSGTGPRAVPLMLWAFLVVEFVGTSLWRGAAVVSAGLLLASLVTLAVTVARSPLSAWRSGADVEPAVGEARSEEPVPARG